MVSPYIRDGGVWKPFTPWGKLAGEWLPAKRAFINQEGVWRPFYQEEAVVHISSDTTDVVLKTLFDSDTWNDPLIYKKVIVDPGVVVGATTYDFAMRTSVTADGQPGSWRGDLVVDNYGILQGKGGVANGGTGGNVLHANLPSQIGNNLVFNNYGTIRSGGGGGGLAGNGGMGYYQYGVQEGPVGDLYGSVNYWAAYRNSPGAWEYVWANNYVGNYDGVVNGAYTYYKGGLFQGSEGDSAYYYTIYRTYVATAYTSGGTGGAGGKGQGHESANAAGTGGTAGGTNAGSGGAGGNGSTWGEPGNVGGTGQTGNYTAGNVGSAGGLAGYYKTGPYVTLNNFGTLQGRLN